MKLETRTKTTHDDDVDSLKPKLSSSDEKQKERQFKFRSLVLGGAHFCETDNVTTTFL